MFRFRTVDGLVSVTPGPKDNARGRGVQCPVTSGSPTQAQDMTALVLFYAHATVVAGTRYKPPSTPRSSSHTRACFAKARRNPRRSSWTFRSSAARSCCSDGLVKGRRNDVTVTNGFLRLFFLGARVVAKMAHGGSAARRLDLQFRVHTPFHALQGVAIPRVVGLYKSGDQDTRVLILSHAGKPLRDFDELDSDERCAFSFCHRRRRIPDSAKGIQHNALEPRNVTKSESGPILIDLDRVEMDHACRGASCAELLAVANALDLDAAAELAAAADDVADAQAASVALSAAVLIVVGGWFLRCG
ncbi:hypothetical protein B0H14DRAFT_3432624 [Mycena olivaceomarginata]|nr:hypothetical protein B0H14DRAFT_3432624 [Mycena olivaceomarginata]